MSKKEVDVVFRVTSNEGDSEYKMKSSKAYAQIKKLMEEQNKWLYIDGKVKSKDLLTESDLINATEKSQDIFMATSLAGGQEKFIDIEFEVSSKVKNAVVVDFEENKYAKVIKVAVSEELAQDVLRNRDTIVRVLKLKLQSLAEEEMQKFAEAQVKEMNEFSEQLGFEDDNDCNCC